ncbi:MAG: hypothetical protein ABL956_13045 [Hyphomonadaceae bacterium]
MDCIAPQHRARRLTTPHKQKRAPVFEAGRAIGNFAMTQELSLPPGFANWPSEARAGFVDAALFKLFPLCRFHVRPRFLGEFEGHPATPNVVIVDSAVRFQRHPLNVADPLAIAQLSDKQLLELLRQHGVSI